MTLGKFVHNFNGHLHTINSHRRLVRKYCFKVGLYRQGLMHDLSKYSPSEFFPGVKYYQDGHRSPNNAQREDKGVSAAWLHHKGRNKHHLEYWIDYAVSEDKKGGKDHCGMTGMKMPVKYVCEMFIDRISASKNYQREKYTDRSPIEYYLKSVDHYMIHEDTKELIEYMLYMLAEKGEKYTFSYVKNEVLKGKVPYDSTSLKKLKDELHVRR